MSNQAMIDLLASFIPRIEHTENLKAHLLSGDPEAVVAYAQMLQRSCLRRPYGPQRAQHKAGYILGVLVVQYILMDELIEAIAALQKQQMIQAAVSEALHAERYLRVVDDLLTAS